MEEQFARLGLRATRIEAVTPETIPAADGVPEIRPGASCRPRSVCSMSHVRAARTLLASRTRRTALILEDDAVLSQSTSRSSLPRLRPAPLVLDALRIEAIKQWPAHEGRASTLSRPTWLLRSLQLGRWGGRLRAVAAGGDAVVASDVLFRQLPRPGDIPSLRAPGPAAIGCTRPTRRSASSPHLRRTASSQLWQRSAATGVRRSRGQRVVAGEARHGFRRLGNIYRREIVYGLPAGLPSAARRQKNRHPVPRMSPLGIPRRRP